MSDRADSLTSEPDRSHRPAASPGCGDPSGAGCLASSIALLMFCNFESRSQNSAKEYSESTFRWPLEMTVGASLSQIAAAVSLSHRGRQMVSVGSQRAPV